MHSSGTIGEVGIYKSTILKPYTSLIHTQSNRQQQTFQQQQLPADRHLHQGVEPL
jgi:hypothetical protein